MNGASNRVFQVRRLGSVFMTLVIVLSLLAFPSAGLAHSSAPGQNRASQEGNGFRSIDDRFAEIAQQVPGFGGMFYDENGQLAMYLVESESGLQQQAASAIETVLSGDARVSAAGTLRVIPGQYDFLQLREWQGRLRTAVLNTPGVNLLDIDEASNRLRIGVAQEDAVAAVEEQIAMLGVPREAVNIDVTEAIHFSATLRDRRRPLVGGLQINFGNFLCTLGFVAKRSGTKGLVTNSHCTNVQGGVEGTVYHQPIASGNTNRIGLELVDPLYFSGGGCPAGRVCRFSDSSFARVPHTSGPSVNINQGFIARTTGLGSITIAGSNGRYRIVSEVSFPIGGEILNKVGRTTGWTQGVVAATCVDTNVSGTNITQICQDYVNAGVGPGDSGSPVFLIANSPRPNDVQLYGVLWGGNTSGTQFVFSAMSNMESELGTLTTCVSAFSC